MEKIVGREGVFRNQMVRAIKYQEGDGQFWRAHAQGVNGPEVGYFVEGDIFYESTNPKWSLSGFRASSEKREIAKDVPAEVRAAILEATRLWDTELSGQNG